MIRMKSAAKWWSAGVVVVVALVLWASGFGRTKDVADVSNERNALIVGGGRVNGHAGIRHAVATNSKSTGALETESAGDNPSGRRVGRLQQISPGANSDREQARALEDRIVSAKTGALITSRLASLIRDTQKFTVAMEQLSRASIYGSQSIANRDNYQSLFIRTLAETDGGIDVERLECGEHFCMARIDYQNEKELDDYLDKLSRSGNPPLKALGKATNGLRAQLIFSTQKTGMFRVN